MGTNQNINSSRYWLTARDVKLLADIVESAGVTDPNRFIHIEHRPIDGDMVLKSIIIKDDRGVEHSISYNFDMKELSDGNKHLEPKP